MRIFLPGSACLTILIGCITAGMSCSQPLNKGQTTFAAPVVFAAPVRSFAPALLSESPVFSAATGHHILFPGAVCASGYLIPDSNDRYLSDEDLDGLSRHQLRLARNEIYARHSCVFQDPEIQRYFDQKSWYYPVRGRWASTYHNLSRIEKRNADFILRREQGGRTSSDSSGYIIPESDSRILTSDDLSGLSSAQLRLARNEIYARHGCLFRDPDLQRYFNRQSWYRPVRGRWASEYRGLTSIEKRNADRIQQFER